MEQSGTKFRERLRQLGPAGLLGLLWVTMPPISGTLLLYHIGSVSEWLQARTTFGLLIYVSIFVLAGGLGFLPTYAQAIVGGWVFGLALGIPAALAGFAGASLLGYLIARLVSRDSITSLIERNRKARAVRDFLLGRGAQRTTGVVALLRVPPQSPFALTNLVMAGTGVAPAPFLLGTVLGMIPRTFVAVFFASSAARTGARDIQALVQDGPGLAVSVGGIVLMLLVLGFIGYMAKQALLRLGTAEPVGSDSPADVNQTRERRGA